MGLIYKQSAYNGSGNTGSLIANNWASNNTLGSFFALYVFIYVSGGIPAGRTFSISDTGGNSWTALINTTTSSTNIQAIFVCNSNTYTGKDAITISWNTAGLTGAILATMVVGEWTGQASGNPVTNYPAAFLTATTSGSSSPYFGTFPTIRAAWTNETIIVFGGDNNQAATAAAGWTMRVPNEDYLCLMDGSFAAPGNYAASYGIPTNSFTLLGFPIVVKSMASKLLPGAGNLFETNGLKDTPAIVARNRFGPEISARIR